MDRDSSVSSHFRHFWPETITTSPMDIRLDGCTATVSCRFSNAVPLNEISGWLKKLCPGLIVAVGLSQAIYSRLASTSAQTKMQEQP